MSYTAPILTKQYLDKFAISVLNQYDKSLSVEPKSVPIETIIECHLGLEIDYKCIDKNREILGLIMFGDGYIKVFDQRKNRRHKIYATSGTIILDDQLPETNLGRFRFTCAHEASHWLLHRRLIKKTKACRRTDVENVLFDKTDWLEWQANYLASAILMPENTFKRAFYKMLRTLEIRQKYLYVDSQPCNIRNLWFVTNALSNRFDVSKQACEVRLAKLGLLIRKDDLEKIRFA